MTKSLRKNQRERQAQAAVDRKRKLFAAGGVAWDPRTAMGRRPLDISGLGLSTRISVGHFNACLKNKADRTAARRVAWSLFDQHCHLAHEGELPVSQFEPRVSSSGTRGPNQGRLDALREDRMLAAYLGRDMHGLLLQVIYFQRDYVDLTGQGYGNERMIAGMFRRALDLAATYWNLHEDTSFMQGVLSSPPSGEHVP